MITEEDFQVWLENPVTKALRAWASSGKETLKEQWAAGTFTDQQHFGTAIANAKAIGECQVYEAIVKIEFSQLENEP